MQKVLRKRIFRDLKENFLRYLALGILIAACMFIVVALLGAADTIIMGAEKYCEENNLEDGQFTVFVPLNETQKAELANQGVTLEEQFYLDFAMPNEGTVRVYKNRETIDLVEIIEGELADDENDIVLLNRYAIENGIEVGDDFTLAGEQFTVSGIGCSPDYDLPIKNFSDSAADNVFFGTAFVTEDAYRTLLDSGKSRKTEEYVYSYKLGSSVTEDALRDILSDYKVDTEDIEDEYFMEYWTAQTAKKNDLEKGINELVTGSSDLAEALAKISDYNTGIEEFDNGIDAAADGADELKQGMVELKESTDEFFEEVYASDISNLVSFLPACDNARVGGAMDDQIINKYGGLLAGVILIVLFAYVISVFVIYSIEKESSTIGALYALGVKRKELMKHYLFLPIMVTFIAGLIGFALGYSGIGGSSLMGDSYSYFSIPFFDRVYPVYLVIYAVVMPPVAAALVNYLVINSKLKKPALQMLRNEQKQKKISNIKLGNLGFITKFRIRQMLRELRSSLTVLGGMFIALLILMLGINCWVLCIHIRDNQKEDTKFEYMYTYKYPDEEVPEGGFGAYAESVKKDRLGYKLDVTIMGISEDNPFFALDLPEKKNSVVISSAMAEKFNIKAGETVVVNDEEAEMNYAFFVEDIAEYATSYYIFMDIENMREMFDREEDYFNVVFSDRELDIPSEKLYAITSRNDIAKASEVFVELMIPMITLMIAASIIIFVVVMYLMMKIMIDRSAFHISMVKVFGYRMREIKKLYLNGNFYIIAVGALLCIPLAKLCMNFMYPVMIANVATGMDLSFPLWLYLVIYGGILALYTIINQMLVSRLRKVNLAEVLKNRE